LKKIRKLKLGFAFWTWFINHIGCFVVRTWVGEVAKVKREDPIGKRWMLKDMPANQKHDESMNPTGKP